MSPPIDESNQPTFVVEQKQNSITIIKEMAYLITAIGVLLSGYISIHDSILLNTAGLAGINRDIAAIRDTVQEQKQNDDGEIRELRILIQQLRSETSREIKDIDIRVDGIYRLIENNNTERRLRG